MFNTEVKFITYDDSLHLKNGDLKTYKYEGKKRSDESVYDAGKRSYCERRGGSWRGQRPRQIRQLESKLKDRSVVHCEWLSENLITIIFSNGAIAYLTVKPANLDITQVLFDRYCVGKLSNQTVCSAVFCKSHLLLMHADRTGTLVSFGKLVNTQPCHISDRDPHLQNIELGGGLRRAERKISFLENNTGVRVLIWGTATADPAPWSPALEDLANLHLYQFTGTHISLLAYHQLENETLSAELAYTSDNVIHVVEQIASHKNGVSLEWLRYELAITEDRTTKLSSLTATIIQANLVAPVRYVKRSPCDTKLLATCIDGSLHVIHHIAGLIHSTKAGFIATDVRWAGEVILAVEEGGRMQCFDRALSLLNHHTKCIDFASHLRDTRRLQILATKTVKGGPMILVSFCSGPLALLRIIHPKLLTAWIRCGRTGNAVSLLRSIEWETEGTEGLWAVNRIVCDSLRNGLQSSGETAAQSALGAYLAPLAPHGPQAERLAPALHDLARKFFHHLLRRGRVEKALSLAVDLADWDLFADARWAAARLNLQPLAEEAASLATHYAEQESNSSDSCSQCSSHSYTDSGDETSLSSEARTKPPPLPRVPIPNNPQTPTIVHVPISQAEQTSTNSIRPNLHQYFERDNTIWNRTVRDDTNLNYEIKPIINTQNVRWHSVDNIIFNNNYKQNHHTLLPIKEGSSKTMLSHDDRTTPHFRNVLKNELREVPNTLYRYQSSNNYLPTPNASRQLRDELSDKSRTGEKNKVKFSDTVTIAVMPETGVACPMPARELADSLPLCPPHAYLAAFTPAPPPAAAAAGTALDYVEV